jgi:hypothetical protein
MADPASDDLTPLDLALGEGSSAQRQEAAARAAAEPPLLGELADNLSLLQRIRGLHVDERPGFSARMVDVERQHTLRRARLAATRRWVRRSVSMAAAALLLVALVLWSGRGSRSNGAWPAKAGESPLLTLAASPGDYVTEQELDKRVDRLAGLLAEALPARLADPGTAPEEVALMVRALAASGQARNGSPFGPDLQVGSRWLVERLPSLHGGQLAVVLESLSMAAAENGSQVEAVAAHCRRLVGELLAEPHGTQTADLLSATAPPTRLAACGRLLAVAPAFGVDAAQAAGLRQLLAAGLEERRRVGDSQELMAALLFGFADLVEREPVDRTLRQLQPTTIRVADLGTLHQIAASIEPGVRGWTGFLLQLRRLATCPIPASATAKSDLLLCLTSNAFVSRSCKFSQIVAFARRT